MLPLPAAAGLPSRSDGLAGQAQAAASAAPETVAAIDLGSNSFHMVVGRIEHGGVTLLDRIREMVRLGEGLNSEGCIDAEVAERALACLSRFAERLTSLEASSVRAVGTNTLRRSRDGAFLQRAEAALGCSIEVISGVEEARLVYLGAAHSLPQVEGGRLVVDIGGGSTELIIGEGLQPTRLESLYMGCVSFSQRFFPEGRITREAFEAARLVARQELEPVGPVYRRVGWAEAAGTSGTIRAAARVVATLNGDDGVITRDGLAAVERALIDAGDVRQHGLTGLGPQRSPVFPGGIAILIEVFDALGVEAMTAADGALREGLLYDHLGRLSSEDARDRSVQAIATRLDVDEDQAARVRTTAERFFDELAGHWDLDAADARRLLGWAAEVHEAGLGVAHAGHHRHGAYVLRNADLAGFSTAEQVRLAVLVCSHRRKIHGDCLDEVASEWRQCMRYLIVILRLAVVLHRSRSPEALPGIGLKPGKRSLKLKFPDGWLETHPLTRADLEQESTYLANMDFKLKLA